MRSIDDPQDDLSVTPPKDWAAGVPAVAHALEYSLSQTSPRRTALTLLNLTIGPLLAGQHPVLRTFILATVAVPIVIYGLMPQLHRLRVRLLARAAG